MFDEKPHRSIMMRDLRATQRVNKTGKNTLSNEISKHPQCPTTASPALSYSAESIQHMSYCLFLFNRLESRWRSWTPPPPHSSTRKVTRKISNLAGAGMPMAFGAWSLFLCYSFQISGTGVSR